jgi:hypothetical protein
LWIDKRQEKAENEMTIAELLLPEVDQEMATAHVKLKT